MLRELESSSEGCRRLIDEWTRLLEWLGRLGPEGLISSEIGSRLDNLLRALGLLGVRIADTGAAAVATADPLAASFLQAWKVVEDYAIREFMEQDLDEDDDPPDDEPGPAPEVMASHWAAVGVALLKLAAERCARLRTLLAGYEQSEAEARARLAYEASFDDSAEGERLHRYQARWGRSLLRTLASLEELRGRSEAETGRGSPPDEGRMSHGCARMDTDKTEGQESFDPGEETSGCEDCVTDLTSDVVSSICDEPCSSEAGAGLAGGEREAVTNQGSSARQKENCQNKPTAERSTVVEKGPRAQGLVGNKATGEHRPDRESTDRGRRDDPQARGTRVLIQTRMRVPWSPHDPRLVAAAHRWIGIGVNLAPAGLTHHPAASNLKIHDEFLILSRPRRSTFQGAQRCTASFVPRICIRLNPTRSR